MRFFGRYRIVTATIIWVRQKCWKGSWIGSIRIDVAPWVRILSAPSSKTTVANSASRIVFYFLTRSPTLGQPMCKIAKFWVQKLNPYGLITLRNPYGHPAFTVAGKNLGQGQCASAYRTEVAGVIVVPNRDTGGCLLTCRCRCPCHLFKNGLKRNKRLDASEGCILFSNLANCVLCAPPAALAWQYEICAY